ncbi:MAG: tetratricopeptide repeat protein [Verrucomicrobia bacterium]|nr:tetratricopeptide repeat protein [Verrucomicrobiota bacterium]
MPNNASAQREQASGQTQLLLRGALIVALVLLAYFPALRAGFIWDDESYVTENPLLTAPDGLKRIWFSAHKQNQYFPLVYTTLRFERSLWGLDPMGYHLVNVLLHGANTLLVWTLLRRLAVPGAWLAAAVFALHPVQVESVAWVTELKNTQSTLFYLLALLVWMKFTENQTTQRWRLYLLCLFLHALALFSKTTACTLPAAMLLVFWLRKEPIRWPRVVQIAPFLLLGIAMGLVSIWWEGHLGNYTKEVGLAFGWPERLLIATRAVWFYLGKLIWPSQLSFSYPRWEINPCDALQYSWLAAGIAFGLLLWWRRHAWGRAPLAAMVFFVAALSPMLGLVSLYTFRYTFVADHYQYLACLGPIALFVGALSSSAIIRRLNQSVRGGLSCLLLLVLGALTWQQTHIYLTLETLWHDTLEKNPESWMAHNNLGSLLSGAGKSDEAIDHFKRAIQINPNQWVGYNNLGWELVGKGQFEEAIGHFSNAVHVLPAYGLAHCNWGIALEGLGRTKEAILHYRKALRLNPQMPRALNNLAWILATHPEAEVRNGAEAVRLAERACQLTDYTLVILVGTLGAAYAESGRFEEAVATANRAAALATSAGNIELAEKNLKLAELFKSGQAFRESPRPADGIPAFGNQQP